MSEPAKQHPAIRLLREDPLRFATQGTVTTTWRTYRGRRLGPYYRLAWRENGRQRSIYLGRQSPVVDEVRQLLHEAQTIRRMLSEHRRRQALFREHVIRPIQRYLQEIFLLFGNGLYLDGWQLRGAESAGPRLTVADVPQHLVPEFPVPPPHILAQIHGIPNTEPDDTDNTPATQPPSPNTTSEESPYSPDNHEDPKPHQTPHTTPEALRERAFPLPASRTAPAPQPNRRSEAPLKFVDQKLPRLSRRRHLSLPQHRHPRPPLQFVDQRLLPATRGPPKKGAITFRRDERPSIARATHHHFPNPCLAK